MICVAFVASDAPDIRLSLRTVTDIIFKETGIWTLPSLYFFLIIMYVRKNVCDFPTDVDDPNAARSTGKLKVQSNRAAETKKSFLGFFHKFLQ